MPAGWNVKSPGLSWEGHLETVLWEVGVEGGAGSEYTVHELLGLSVTRFPRLYNSNNIRTSLMRFW